MPEPSHPASKAKEFQSLFQRNRMPAHQEHLLTVGIVEVFMTMESYLETIVTGSHRLRTDTASRIVSLVEEKGVTTETHRARL